MVPWDRVEEAIKTCAACQTVVRDDTMHPFPMSALPNNCVGKEH